MNLKGTDVFSKCAGDGGSFGRLRAAGDSYFTRPTLSLHPGPRMEYGGRPVVMWSVNNYIGLAGHPEIAAVAREALEAYGLHSPMGSRMMSGTTDLHLAFESELADFARKEAAILFNYGYMGVTGTIESLLGPEDTVIIDKLSHACIVDGAQASQARMLVFRHNNLDSLETALKRANKDRKGGVLVCCEGTYGMTGDIADLRGICDLKDRYDARLFVDDAHGCGVFGEEGRGLADHLGVQDRVDLYFGTFAKAFASIGGFTAGPAAVVDWIRYNARTQVFAKSLPLVYVEALRKTLKLLRGADEARDRMWRISARLKSGLRDLGFTVGPGDSPICAVFVNSTDPERTGMESIQFLRERGVFVSAVVYPVIPPGLLMYRMIPTAAHSEKDVEDTLPAFRALRDESGIDLALSDEVTERLSSLYRYTRTAELRSSPA